MPEWYLLIAVLGVLSALGAYWKPLLLVLPFLVLTIVILVVQSSVSAARASFPSWPRSRPDARWYRLRLHVLTACLHLIQPLGRLRGRLRFGLSPWRRRGDGSVNWRSFSLWPRTVTLWSESWRAPASWLQTVEDTLKDMGAVVWPGGDYDRWDLEARGGLLATARLRMVVEEHGGGKQYVRFNLWPRIVPGAIVLLAACIGLAIGAWLGHAPIATGFLVAFAVMVVLSAYADSALARAMLLRSVGSLQPSTPVTSSQRSRHGERFSVATSHAQEVRLESANMLGEERGS